MPTEIFTASQSWVPPANVYRIAEVFILGGGGGGGGGGAAGGGGGGGGGRVYRTKDVRVTPGVPVSVVVGAGGLGGGIGLPGSAGGSSSFGTLTALGGGGGAANNGAGGSSGLFDNVSIISINSTYSSILNNVAVGAGSGAGGSPTTVKDGSNGFSYTYINSQGLSTTNYFGPGGGAGCSAFIATTTRPLYPGVGGIEGGGTGASEDNPLIVGVELPATAGGINTGGGGGGGGASGTSPVRNPTPVTVPASAGAAGGSGIVIIKYNNTAQFRLGSSQPGVEEGGVITITLETEEVATGTVVPFTITGTGITASDFESGLSAGTLNGSFTIASTTLNSASGERGLAQINLTVKSDVLNDSNDVEVATLSLNNGLASISFYIGDSSRSPITPTKLIETADYNNIRNKLLLVIGPSSTANPTYGWGQSIVSTPVTVDSSVTVNEWGALRYDIINAWAKIFDTIPNLALPAVGQSVRANVSTAPYTQYDSFANAIMSNRGIIASTRAIVRNKNEISYATPWGSSISTQVTATFSTADAARHFFNSGGEIRFASSIPVAVGSIPTPKTQSWVNHLTSTGTRGFGGSKPDVLTTPANGLNYFRLTSTFQVWYTSATSGSYSGNIYKISARSVDAADNSSGTASIIEFLFEWIDSTVPIISIINGVPTPNATDIVDGPLILSTTTLEPTGILQPPGAGNFVVESPVVTSIPISGS